MIVGARLEPYLPATLAVVPGQGVGVHELQRMPQVRGAIHVGNRGGDV
jgi:hypothetical protein